MNETREDDVRRLIQRAGPRPTLPPAARLRLRVAAEEAWHRKVQNHRRQQRRQRRGRLVRWSAAVATLAAAAMLLLVLRPTLWSPQGDPPGASSVLGPVATLLSAQGALSFEGVPRGGATLPTGATLSTGEGGRAALWLEARQAELRLDQNSRLRLVSPDTVELERGALYFDASAHPLEGEPAPAFQVLTPWGTARDIGTQFEVRLQEEALRIRVREGAVLLELPRGEGTHRADAGVELTLDTASVARGDDPDAFVQRAAIATHGPAWQWVLEAAPPFEIEGRTLGEFLGWLSRESGWRLQYDTPALGERAAEIILHGSIAGLSAEEAVDVIVAGSALSYRLEEGVLTIY
jgi:ferric-dicitrate binding protein FerR (iron transport regulator)